MKKEFFKDVLNIVILCLEIEKFYFNNVKAYPADQKDVV